MPSNDPINTEAAKQTTPFAKLTFEEAWGALKLLWSEYTWVTRGATLALIVVALLSIAKAFPCLYAPLCLSAPWVEALSSDGMMSLLTLVIALGVGIHLKVRQKRGLLDGAEHYSIGRALAYGYFSNFLIGALLFMEQQSKARALKGKDRLKLRVVFPRTVAELDEFRTSIELDVRAKTKNQPIENIFNLATQTMRRNILVLDRAVATSPGAQDFYLDFPTTLYTVQDYYACWNIWLKEQQESPIGKAEIASMQQKQIDDFFKHLEDLSRSEVGVEAMRKLGVTIDTIKLSQLYENYFVRLGPSEMLEELKNLEQPKAGLV